MLDVVTEQLAACFDEFVAASEPVMSELEHHMGSETVRTAIAEASHAIRIVGPYLEGRSRVLEVGSGMGVLSGFLGSLGYDVTALEPGGVGYEERSAVADLVRSWGSIDFRSSRVEDLDPDIEKPFDLIFSINVMEHVEDVSCALSAMVRVLGQDGCMVHECPNYIVPFEPHFGLPLLPFIPHRTARLLPASVAGTALWQSLNFITARRVRRMADSLDLSIEFQPALMAAAVDRLNDDREFRRRHRWLGRTAAGLQRTGLIRVLSRLPAEVATPMVFRLERA